MMADDSPPRWESDVEEEALPSDLDRCPTGQSDLGRFTTLSLSASTAEDAERADRWRRAAALKLRGCRRGFSDYVELAARLPLGEASLQISKDLPRTFGVLRGARLMEIPGMPESEVMQRELEKVLKAWSSRSFVESLGTGYVQGMGFIAALPFAVAWAGQAPHAPTLGGGARASTQASLQPDRDAAGVSADRSPAATAFGILATVVEDVMTPAVFAVWPPLIGHSAAAAVLMEEVRNRMPCVAELLGEQLGDLVDMLCTRWLLSAFVGCLPLRPLLRLWDQMLAAPPQDSRAGERLVLLLQWGCGLIAHAEPQLLALGEDPTLQGEPWMILGRAHAIIVAESAALPYDFCGAKRIGSAGWDRQLLLHRYHYNLSTQRRHFEEARALDSGGLSNESIASLRAAFEREEAAEQGRCEGWIRQTTGEASPADSESPQRSPSATRRGDDSPDAGMGRRRSAGGYLSGTSTEWGSAWFSASKRNRAVRRQVNAAPDEWPGLSVKAAKRLISQVVPKYPTECLDKLFLLLDVQRVGRLDFYELTVGVQLLDAGIGTAKKLALVFDLYDVDDSKGLTKEEVEVLAAALLAVRPPEQRGWFSTGPAAGRARAESGVAMSRMVSTHVLRDDVARRDAEGLAQRLMLLDATGSGTISMDEWTAGAMATPELIAALAAAAVPLTGRSPPPSSPGSRRPSAIAAGARARPTLSWAEGRSPSRTGTGVSFTTAHEWTPASEHVHPDDIGGMGDVWQPTTDVDDAHSDEMRLASRREANAGHIHQPPKCDKCCRAALLCLVVLAAVAFAVLHVQGTDAFARALHHALHRGQRPLAVGG